MCRRSKINFLYGTGRDHQDAFRNKFLIRCRLDFPEDGDQLDRRTQLVINWSPQPGKVAEPIQKKLQAVRQHNRDNHTIYTRPTRPFENLGLMDSGPTISPFRLLDLAYGTRTLIDSCLIPDDKGRLGVRFIHEAPPFRGYISYLPRLRYPPIALTNRQLYKEV